MLKKILLPAMVLLAGCQSVNTTQPGTVGVERKQNMLVSSDSVNRSAEVSLQEGLRFERRLFHALFATEDQKEGMAAFVEKREPQFRDR